MGIFVELYRQRLSEEKAKWTRLWSLTKQNGLQTIVIRKKKLCKSFQISREAPLRSAKPWKLYCSRDVCVSKKQRKPINILIKSLTAQLTQKAGSLLRQWRLIVLIRLFSKPPARSKNLSKFTAHPHPHANFSPFPPPPPSSSPTKNREQKGLLTYFSVLVHKRLSKKLWVRGGKVREREVDWSRTSLTHKVVYANCTWRFFSFEFRSLLAPYLLYSLYSMLASESRPNLEHALGVSVENRSSVYTIAV